MFSAWSKKWSWVCSHQRTFRKQSSCPASCSCLYSATLTLRGLSSMSPPLSESAPGRMTAIRLVRNISCLPARPMPACWLFSLSDWWWSPLWVTTSSSARLLTFGSCFWSLWGAKTCPPPLLSSPLLLLKHSSLINSLSYWSIIKASFDTLGLIRLRSSFKKILPFLPLACEIYQLSLSDNIQTTPFSFAKNFSLSLSAFFFT